MELIAPEATMPRFALASAFFCAFEGAIVVVAVVVVAMTTRDDDATDDDATRRDDVC